jgi:hypothetical protein
LHEQRYRFVRYADDFVVMCRSAQRAREARAQVESFLREELGLTLSSEKTKVTTFREGLNFLGLELKSHRCRMRQKAVENFKAKVREETERKRNLDGKVIEKLNGIVRGVVNYFGTELARYQDQFRRLDRW